GGRPRGRGVHGRRRGGVWRTPGDCGRTGPERDRHRSRRAVRPRRRLPRRRPDRLARGAPPHRHRRAVAEVRGGGTLAPRWEGEGGETVLASRVPRRVEESMMAYKVAVLMGSPNDRDKMQPGVDTLERFGLEADVRVLSAHRNPAAVTELAAGAREAGYVAFVCGAGMAAHLAGVVAAHTTLPVVGVPLSGGAINGIDALYSTVQMPRGIPVATVAVDGAMNAALLVVQMLAIRDEALAAKLADHRREIGGG